MGGYEKEGPAEVLCGSDTDLFGQEGDVFEAQRVYCLPSSFGKAEKYGEKKEVQG